MFAVSLALSVVSPPLTRSQNVFQSAAEPMLKVLPPPALSVPTPVRRARGQAGRGRASE
ncbi:hypothetical protein [Hoylesella pleuritidis]|uniref:hypothetical protein n=1 Tax=Hoylesella pleuritidis TaxID=407975 RepID=UPI0012DF567A|nr:hypothetical protein [Hoylesella pleuritidis]